MTLDKRIFLSHASADVALANLLRDSLILGGVPGERIFYSSSRATGIPSGQDVVTYLQRLLRDAGLVIELLSETFLTRPMCLMELGGAWALELSTYPIVVPPLAREEASRQIGNVQMGMLGSDGEIDGIFDELHDRIVSHMGIQVRATAWNQQIREFKSQLPVRLSTVRTAATVPARVGGEGRGSAVLEDGVSADADEIVVSNISVVDTHLGVELHAEATNNDDSVHTAILTATFYGADGGIIGTSQTTLNRIRPGGTKTITFRDIPNYVRQKIEVDLLM